MLWALAWDIKRWVWGVTCGLFSRSLIWGMRNRGVWLLSNTHLNRKRDSQKEHRKEVDFVLWSICKMNGAEPGGHKIRACTWQKDCATESQWHGFSWKSRGPWAVSGCCVNAPASSSSRGCELRSSRESKRIRGQNQWKLIVRQGPWGLLAG